VAYVGSWNGSEYAICTDACAVGTRSYSAGDVIWKYYLGRTSECSRPGSPTGLIGITSTATLTTVNGAPAVVVGGGGNVRWDGSFFPNPQAKIFALDVRTGRPIWWTALGAAPRTYIWSSPRIANNSVYIGVSSEADCPLIQGRIVRVSLATGQVMNSFAVVPPGCLGGSVWGSVTVGPSGNAIFAATGNAGSCSTAEPYTVAILKLSPTLGLLDHWQVPAREQVEDGDFGSTPNVYWGTVYPGGPRRMLLSASNKNGLHYVFDSTRIAAGPLRRLRVSGDAACTCFKGSIAPGAHDGQRLYVAGAATTINGIEFRGSVRAFDPDNFAANPGAPVWSRGFDAPVIGAVTTAPGIVVVGAGSTLYVLAAETGDLLSAASAGRLLSAASLAYGTIYVGDAKAGPLLHALSPNGL
jgi:outer membrane protein assembly factor BamB